MRSGTTEKRAEEAAWMAVVEDFSLRFVVYVGVNRCRNYRTVSEKGLDEAKINALLEQHGGDGVPEHVRCDLFEPGRFGMTAQRYPD